MFVITNPVNPPPSPPPSPDAYLYTNARKTLLCLATESTIYHLYKSITNHLRYPYRGEGRKGSSNDLTVVTDLSQIKRSRSRAESLQIEESAITRSACELLVCKF